MISEQEKLNSFLGLRVLLVSIITAVSYFFIALYIKFKLLERSFLDVVINAHYQISDSSGHYNCFDSYSQFFFENEINAVDAWCQRRPTYPAIMSLFYTLLRGNVNSLIILQIFLTSLTVFYLVMFFIKINFSKVFILFYILVWSIFSLRLVYSLGPELLSYILSSLSLILLINGFINKKYISMVISLGLFLLSFEIRPGNPLFLVFLTFLVLIMGVKFNSKSNPKKLIALLSLILVPFLIIYFIPRWFFSLISNQSFFHGGNLWGTIYGLASPTASSYTDAYSDFANFNFKSEVELWDHTKSETIELLKLDLDPALNTGLDNLKYFFIESPISLSLGLNNFFGPLISLSSFNFSVFLLNSAALTFYLLLFYIKIKYRINNLIFSSLIINLLGSWIILYVFVSTIIGEAYYFTNLKTGRNLLGFEVKGFLIIFLVNFTLYFLIKNKNSVTNFIFLLGITNIFSAALFFIFVGHDEIMRHQTQNVPFYLLFALFFQSWSLLNQSHSAYCIKSTLVNSKSLQIQIITVLVFLFALNFVAQNVNKINLIESCNADFTSKQLIDSIKNPYYQSIAKAPAELPPYNWVPVVLQQLDWIYLYKIQVENMDQSDYRLISLVSNINLKEQNLINYCIAPVEIDDMANQIGHYYRVIYRHSTQ